MKTITLVALFPLALAGSLSAGLQVVTPSPASRLISPGESLAVDVSYTTAAPSDATLTGLGLRLHFDARKLSFRGLTEVLSRNVLMTQGPVPDSSDADHDAETDSYVLASWVDTAGGWPGTPTAKLFTASFTAVAGFDGVAVVRVSASSTAAGYTLSSSPAVFVSRSLSNAAAALGARVVPVILDVTSGAAHFTTELTFTNSGTSAATAILRYEASLGDRVGSGVVLFSLPAGRQLVIADAIAFLRTSGLAIPNSGAQGGALAVRIEGASTSDAASITARTTTATAAPQPLGSAGLAYAAVAPGTGATGTLTLFGLRSNTQDRSNVAVFNPGAEPVTVKMTAFSGAGDGASRVVREAETLGPFAWTQVSGVLNDTGFESGWVTVERTSASGVFGAYGVVNDNGTSDGSFLLPVSSGATGNRVTVPVLVDTAAFQSELVLANRGSTPATLTLSYVESLSASLGAGGRATLTLPPRTQRILPNGIDTLRSLNVPIGAKGAGSYAGSLGVSVAGAALADVFAAARTSSLSPAGGSFGLFTAGVYSGEEATTVADLYGLRADDSNRSNVAVLSAGAEESGDIGIEVTFFDGATGLETGSRELVTLAPGGWKQLTNPLGARGIASGWVHLARLSGSAPWIAYGVVNDGGRPGERTGDGAYVPMTRGSGASVR